MWTYRATLKRIIDADTLELTVDLGFRVFIEVTVRVSGVDCPERNTPEGNAATLFAITLLHPGEQLTVRTKYDRSFARYLGEITLPDGTSYAERLIAAGHGT